MSIISVVGLSASYVLIALLLLGIVTYSNLGWVKKIITVVGVSIFYIFHYISAQGITGWPTNANLPDRFHLIASLVVEPNKQSGKDGEIFIWATSTENIGRQITPRSYKLPYSASLSKKVAEATLKLKRGKSQIGEIVDEKSSMGEEGLGISEKRKRRVAIQFFDLPDPSIPAK